MAVAEEYARHARWCRQHAEEYRRDADEALKQYLPNIGERTYRECMEEAAQFDEEAAWYEQQARSWQ